MTIDGSEGGTGAAPIEFSDSVGMPLAEALGFVHNLLVSLDIREQTTIICAGKIMTGFDIAKMLASGAQVCNSARGMMFALGCIQALKCNTNHCPSGVATQDPVRMNGLVVSNKSFRVANYQKKTLESAFSIIGAMGLEDPDSMHPSMIHKRVSDYKVATLNPEYYEYYKGCLINNIAEPR